MRIILHQLGRIVLPLLFSAVAGRAAALDNWHWRNPVPQGNDLYQAAYGNGTFVLAGFSGTLLSSQDYKNWSLRPASLGGSLAGLIFAHDQFAAYGRQCAGTNCSWSALTSRDGAVWTEQTIGTNQPSTVVFSDGIYVAAAGDQLLSSPDGITWTGRSSLTNGYFSGLANGNGLFVAWAVTYSQQTYVPNTSRIMTSSDGINWTAHFGDGTEFAYDLPRVTFGKGLFVAGGHDYVSHHDPDEAVILTSTEGITWSRAGGRIVGDVRDVAYGSGTFVAVGEFNNPSDSLPYVIMSSVDGTHWFLRRTDLVLPLNTVTYGGGLFLAAGSNGAILVSADGINWQTRWASSVGNLASAAAGNGLLVAVGTSAQSPPVRSYALTSIDGVQWTTRDLPVESLDTVTYGDNGFLAVGFESLCHSVDGSNWSSHTVDYWLRGVTFAAGRYVAVGAALGTNRSAILSSTDAVQWTSLDPGVEGSLFAVAAGNGLFIALGDQAMVISPDASHWTKSSPPDGVYFQTISFGNGLFLAVTLAGAIFTSADGREWARHDSQAGSDWRPSACLWADGFFVVAGDGALSTSLDGTNWTSGRIWPGAVRGIARGANSLVIVGDGGAILQSDPLSPSRPVIVIPPESKVAAPGATVAFTAIVTGSSPLTYWWLRDSSNLINAASSTLVLRNVQNTDVGSYSVVVSNEFGVVTSQPALLKLLDTGSESARLSLKLNFYPELTLIGTEAASYRIDSADQIGALDAWIPAATVSLPPIPFTWIDTRSTNAPHMFYRAIAIP